MGHFSANLLFREYESLSDGEELNDISIYDFIPQTVSAFAQLLMEKENMKIWNDFVNCTEEQQTLLLDEIDKDIGSDEKSADNRNVHVGFSADEAFKRIDADLKNLLKKKHLPLVFKEMYNFFLIFMLFT